MAASYEPGSNLLGMGLNLIGPKQLWWAAGAKEGRYA